MLYFDMPRAQARCVISQFQENISASRRNKIYNRNKIHDRNKIDDVEMKSATADREEAPRRKMSQDPWQNSV